MTYEFVMPDPISNEAPKPADSPQFREPAPTADPKRHTVPHASDQAAYAVLDRVKNPDPKAFPYVSNADEPVLKLEDALGSAGADVIEGIQKAQQIVFHALGDTGAAVGPRSQEYCADKMVSDFNEADPKDVPAFMYHLGDVVYSFGEAAYYYDQFYDIYRNYPAPIFAIAGNHDGMVSPLTTGVSLDAFFNNFCAYGEPFHRTPEAGGLSRTAQIQPGVYFTLEAPFVRISGLYSNSLEDPGVISSEGGTHTHLTDVQLTFLKAALTRAKADWDAQTFTGATIIAVHHPPYVALHPDEAGAGKHNGSPIMLQEIDAACVAADFWPHAILSGHAHNYQRFTRHQDERETPFIIDGNGGHAKARLTPKDAPALRTPAKQAEYSVNGTTVIFENYDDLDYGYLRVIVDTKQLRIEYHPASDSTGSKTPDDSVTVDLATRKLIHYVPADTPIG